MHMKHMKYTFLRSIFGSRHSGQKKRAWQIVRAGSAAALLAAALILGGCAAAGAGAPDSSADGDAAQEPSADETVLRDDALFAPGTIDGDGDGGTVYGNGFFGIRLTCPDGWTMTAGSAEGDGAGDDNAAGAQAADDLPAYLKEGGTVCEMRAASEYGECAASVVLLRLGTVVREMMDPDELAEESARYLEAKLRESAPAETVVSTGRTVFLGEERPCIRIRTSLEGVPAFEAQVFVVRGSYVAAVHAVSYDTDRTDEILAMYEGTGP